MTRVIDFHAHLGDIFHQMKNVTFKTNVSHGDYPNPFYEHDRNGFRGPLIKSEDELPMLIEASQNLCWENTLENLSKILDENKIDFICLFPIHPCNSFEEMLAASKLEPRILPFTSADFSLPVDDMVEKLRKDIRRGARGLKIHPVLQKINLLDSKVAAATELFGKAGLPILSHCGANTYYVDEDADKKNTPEFGDVKYFIEYAKRFPQYNLVAGHAGGLMGGEMEQLAAGTKGLPNVYVDTTFRSAEDIKELVKLFGRERVLFGTDHPFSTHQGSMREVFKACNGDAELLDLVLYSNAARLLHLA